MKAAVYGDTLCAQVTAIALAQTGHEVVWAVPEGISWQAVQAGQPLFRENDLPALFDEQVHAGQLRCVGLDHAVSNEQARVIFLALQPGQLDSARLIVESHAARGDAELVLNQSAGPVGGTEMLQAWATEKGSGTQVVALPDMVQEGNAFNSFTRPEIILLGCENHAAETLVRELLRPFNRRRDALQVMTAREAEFTKLTINGILATRLSFMNDMAQLAESLDVDIETVRRGMGADPRVGEAYLYPGCGFGGPGLSRGVMTLIDTLHARDATDGLLDQVLRVNDHQKEWPFRKFWQYFHGDVSGKRVAIWGAAFKPGTHRVDNGPAQKIIEALWAQGVEVAVHDPLALGELKDWAGDRPLQLYSDPYDATRQADALLLVTEWKAYWSPDWARLRDLMNESLVVDGRNIYDPAYVREQGFVYRGVGRGKDQ